MSNDHKRLTGRAYDQQMSAYFASLRQQAMSRRGLMKLGAGAAMASAGMTGALPFSPGLGALAQERGTFTFALEGDVAVWNRSRL